MRYGLDTNVLISAHLPVFAESAQVRGFLLRGLADDGVRFALTALVLHEFVHVVTDRRRFDPPVAMAEAVTIAGGYLDRTNVDCLAVDERSVRSALERLDAHRLGRRRIADTLLASTLITHGVEAVVTCNPADFAAFDDLVVIDPRRETLAPINPRRAP